MLADVRYLKKTNDIIILIGSKDSIMIMLTLFSEAHVCATLDVRSTSKRNCSVMAGIYVKRILRATHPSEACPKEASQSPEHRRTMRQTMLYTPMSRMASQTKALHARPRSDKPDHASGDTRR